MSMKKFIISMIASIAVLFGVVASVHAAAVFNSPGEMPTMTVTNAVTHPCNFGPITGCWQQSTTARPGDVIAVHIYYKNTSNEPAFNTTLSIQPSRNGTSVSFFGGVASTSGPRATGTAQVTLSTPTTITYMSGGNDAACWMPSATSGCRLVDASALFGSSGFSIGTVNPGEQGVLVARFRVDGSIVEDNECTINSFDADDTSIDDGDSTDLTWRTTGCDYVTLTSVSGHLNPDDSRSVRPHSTTTYTLRAYDNNGNLGDTDTVTIHVNDNGDECSIDSFTASPSSIDRGDDSRLRWNTSGDVDYVTISGFSGSYSDDDSVTVSPYSTTTYTLRAHCNNGDTETDTVTVRVNNTQVSSQPQAITTVATILGGTQARLNGIAVPNTSSGTTRAWFEWGTGTGFGNRTNSQTVQSGFASQYYSDVISGLVPGATYYYRAVVQNNDGTAYGDTVRFQTQRTVVTTTPPVIVRPTTTTTTVVAKSAPSLLELRVESNYDRMCVNGSMEYTISYRNISNQTLDNAVLRFTHPKEITYLNASRGNYEVVDRTMTIDLGDIRPNESGTIIVHARVNDSAIRGNLTVATTSVVYTNTVSRAQEDAIAYALITVSDDCPNILGASAAGFGSFLPSTLLGWLLLILVILALIVLGRQFYKKTDRPQ